MKIEIYDSRDDRAAGFAACSKLPSYIYRFLMLPHATARVVVVAAYVVVVVAVVAEVAKVVAVAVYFGHDARVHWG